MKTGKVWGSTACEISSPLFELHKLDIKPQMRCSLHSHTRKWNGFYVLKGKLFIDVVKQDYALTDVTELGPGEVTAVKPGEQHSFRTGKQGCLAIEFYYPDVLSDDIQRADHGGSTKAITSRRVRSRRRNISAKRGKALRKARI